MLDTSHDFKLCPWTCFSFLFASTGRDKKLPHVEVTDTQNVNQQKGSIEYQVNTSPVGFRGESAVSIDWPVTVDVTGHAVSPR